MSAPFVSGNDTGTIMKIGTGTSIYTDFKNSIRM